jgi:hypothetical protein
MVSGCLSPSPRPRGEGWGEGPPSPTCIRTAAAEGNSPLGANGSCASIHGMSPRLAQGWLSSGKRKPIGESPGYRYSRSSRMNHGPVTHEGPAVPTRHSRFSGSR